MKQMHFIERQKLHFEFTSEEKAKEWNKGTATFYREEVVPVLEKLFDKHVPSEQWYSIPSLEIDLGNIYARDFKNVLSKKIEAELIVLLGKDISAQASAVKVGNSDSLTAHIQVKSQNQKLLEIFYTFLEHGVFPWNSPITTTKLLEQEISKHINDGQLSPMREFRVLMRLHVARQRLSHQFTKPFRERILQSTFSKEVRLLTVFKNFILKSAKLSSLDNWSRQKIKSVLSSDVTSWIISEPSNQPTKWPETITFSMLEKITESKTNSDQLFDFFKALVHFSKTDEKAGRNAGMIRLIKHYIASFIASRESAHPSLKSTKSFGEDIKPTENQNISSAFESLDGRHDTGDSSPNAVKPDSVAESRISDKDIPMGSSEDAFAAVVKSHTRLTENKRSDQIIQQNEAFKENEESPMSKELTQGKTYPTLVNDNKLKKQTEDTDETPVTEALHEYFVLNAGIVLCWPYLVQLFQRTGYLNEKRFKDEECQERSIHLMGYLAGFEECDEHQLTIAKLLGNWPLSKPISKWLKLTSKEKKESTDMLGNLISNWPILKNTSVEGLQTAFFQREGKLRKEEQGWKLIVEQKSYDMLLDHLSYSIAIIKLPWMEKILKVDWA
jgi:hypothetical protein